MERLTGSAPLPAAFRGGVIALGNFDGFHIGHQAVVARAIDRARAEGRPAIVATFDPHPASFFRPGLPPFRLTTLDQRARLFAAAGADAMLVIGFDRALADLTPDRFVEEALVARFGAGGIVTGFDFTFGKARAGSTAMLAEIGPAHGFTAEVVGPIEDAGGPVSSTRIRRALETGDCEEAARLMSRPFAIAGRVIHGDKRGRTIGYPTANMDMADYQRPLYGIYAVRARLDDGRVIDGAANLGIRPTFDPPKELLETYLFDVSESLYDREMEVELVSFIRPEAKFDGLDSLVAQMDADCEEARRRLSAAA
ncbi:bifunctional riboflavin kinase/FAD synthetase [Sphingomonas sp.]|uniref:bifunctional riboflavin kinase/FAD synthetase n=1 Tax=Sphingomonas sp. TaxID=28214 RepID=UPI000DB3288A|nr:bifunctional riboflavin kinase/FAD synthetase [Sphingomonas sp.]PZU07470.1 MAG: bifunctional riboflavin kinase/FMN adenylyltransferase [Sphingomonas sp.]